MYQAWLGIFALLSVTAYTLWHRGSRNPQPLQSQCHQDPPKPEKDPYQDIEPLVEFDWTTTPPIRNAPLKPKYHLTMSVEKSTLSDLIAMDNTYAERMQVRRRIINENTDATVRCNPVCQSAVLELHDWIFDTYLPGRFPKMYRHENAQTGRQLINLVSNEHIPLDQQSPLDALRALGGHVDTDFLLLLPSSEAENGSPIYHLEAFVCCFPSGFSLRNKMGFPLAAIHAPVPGYKEKLEKSMDRFFARLELGKVVKRSNWALTTDPRLFSEGGNHLYSDRTTSEKVDTDDTQAPTTATQEKVNMQAQIDEEKATVAIENCRLRTERQTLFRLPKSRAIVFSFKTYQYLLADVKKEGYGDKLAEAINGLKLGNVPEMMVYKRGVVWGDVVREYLLS